MILKTTLFTLDEVVSKTGIGKVKLLKFMRERKIITQENKPTIEYKGLFQVRKYTWKNKECNKLYLDECQIQQLRKIIEERKDG
jgi:phage antirepressor YoqD-like protein